MHRMVSRRQIVQSYRRSTFQQLKLTVDIMKTSALFKVLVLAAASAALPAFASGYGPAPFYRPDVGAPASQRGQSAPTIAAERGDARSSTDDVGGVAKTTVESGAPNGLRARSQIYAAH